jgi:two-component system nitrogen regulation sensor histidine kinase GlnL
MATALLVLSADNRVLFMNTAAEGLLGCSIKRAQEQPLLSLVPALFELDEFCTRAREQQQSFGRTLHLPAPQRDGSELELAVRATPLAPPLGSHVDQQAKPESLGELLVELVDVTQRNQLDKETALVAQHGVSRRMLQQLAHEIRNPLGGLRGAAQLLERDLADASLREFTRVIIGEADRLEGLVAGLLGPRERPELLHINVHEIIEHVATIVHSEAPALTILRDYDPSLPALLMDRDQVTQALLNLLRNASQATAGSGQLTLRSRVRTNYSLNRRSYKLVAVIEIEDDGPGVPAEIADTIFYPLVSSKAEGSGIGLPLAQELINRHSGLIEFSSRPGRTVFAVSLPVLSAQDNGAA